MAKHIILRVLPVSVSAVTTPNPSGSIHEALSDSDIPGYLVEQLIAVWTEQDSDVHKYNSL